MSRVAKTRSISELYHQPSSARAPDLTGLGLFNP